MFRLKDSGGLRRAGKRGWDPILPLWPILFGIFVGLVSGGCSSGPTTPSLSLVNEQGTHSANFLSTHPGFVGSAASDCRTCHGDDLTGGIANTSCFTAACHHGTVPGWDTPAVHGALAKGAPGGISGFNACQICHASDFTGDGSLVSCLNNAACHGAGVQSPHPPAPWTRSGGSDTTHTDTVPQNAAACALCHLGGGSVVVTPPTPPPAGSNPGCFNNTLCHDQREAPHAIDAAWLDPAIGGANFHGLTAKQDLVFCQTCHGTPGTTQFDGGAVPTSCSASSCHPAAKAHPIPWFAALQPFPNYVASHRDSGNRDVACAICHKVDGPGAGPDAAAPSCFTDSQNGTSCHANGPGNAPHATDLFLDHTSVTQDTFTDSIAGCSNCHSDTGTSPLSAAPTCTTCHGEGLTGSITGNSPLTNLNCTSCHSQPPSGSVYPNVAGGHSGHDALNSAGTPVDCDTCHAGLGSGGVDHYDRANARQGKNDLRVPPGDASFGATYAANPAALPFINTDLTCAGISCHGGQTTPDWQTGTIDVHFDSGPGVTPVSGCRQCHVLGTAQGVPEYNSPFSGLHQTHLEQISSSPGGNALCTECHDMANGSTGANNHFLFLSTLDLLEGPASETVIPADKNTVFSAGTYTVSTQTCTVTCHDITHEDFSWTGGANHAIPYLDPRHTTMNATNFDGDCGGACHTVSPSSPSSSPPTCQTCHQAGSPLTATNCTSCHASPPSSGSTAAYPNVEGRHTEHDALGGVTGNCSACHTGLANGSLAHYNRANARTGENALRVSPGDVSIVSTYFAKPSGTVAAFNTAFTCSNVSCHGGILTPRWDTGTINVNFDSGPGVTPVSGCRQCHTLGTAFGTPQNNSAWSGLHQKHLQGISGRPGGNALCTECHDMANGTTGANNHFTNLDTAVMEGPPGQTVQPDDKGSTVPAGTYTASTKTCAVTCHTQSHSGWRWDGPETNHALGSAWSDPAVGGSSFHGTQARQDLTFCQTCHGAPGTTGFGGGTAVTSCAASTCHPNARAHPTDWQGERTIGTATITHRSATDPSNLAGQCALCHKVDGPGAGPQAGAPSCFSASFTNANGQNRGCHSGGPGGANHPVPPDPNLETSHLQATQTTFTADCSSCHSDTGTSPSTAPNCVSCHTNFASSNPLTTKNCTSCHGDPPTGTTTYPNIEGGHAEHNALTGVTGVCSACHNGLDPGNDASAQQAHYAVAKTKAQPGDAAFLSTYNAKSGAASFNSSAFTCANVSCHGGLPAPSWRTGTINSGVDAGCRQCHALGTALGTPENNSPFSGLHSLHLGSTVNALCTECHDMANGTAGATNHFTSLNTPQMEGNAGLTIEPLGVAANYNASNQSCTVTCHTQSHSGWRWDGSETNHALGSAWSDPAVGGSSFHGTQAKQDLTFCQTCHGAPGTTGFGGGTAVTSCAASTCHPNARAHPTDWQGERTIGTATITHRSATDPSNLAGQCALCHKVDGPGAGPQAGAPSCFSASFTNANGQNRGCHSGGPGGANHSVPNLDTSHFQASNFGNCSSCHSDTGTSPSTAPNCVSCHTNFASSNPLTTKNCTSCHADPPAGTTTYPNIEGGHAEHNALTGVTGVCSACHNGLDPGNGASAQQAHYAGAKSKTSPGDAAFLSTYNAKSGAASFNSSALTCANVSCHGGLPAPNWRTGSINVNSNTGCLACHILGTAQGTPENNSPFSGLHSSHLGTTINALCTECHGMQNGSGGALNHFTSLNTPQMEGPANQTVTFPGLSGATYNSGSQNCTLTCHGTSHTDFSWSGGTNHSVPYLDTAHTNVSSSTFSSSCSACHDQTGSTTKSGPTCTVCHQAGSPLTLANCTSCHADPPAGTTTYPNIEGSHAEHNALTGVTNLCTPCHNGLDTGSQAHYDRSNARPGMNALRVAPGDAAFLTTFNAKAGAASFNSSALTCANVSCHGGLPAPNWRTGSINVNSNTGCLACHILGTAQGTPENNSPFSGLHSSHLGTTINALCTECHGMQNGSGGALNHFTSLNTPQMEGPANQTVTFPGLSGATYNSGSQNCTLTCHAQLHNTFPWSGNVTPNHSLPDLDASHTTATQADFNGNCNACHNLTGTSPVSAAPVCDSCHTNLANVSPLTTKNCTSCHADPPTGTTPYPNIERAHAEHNALAGVTGVCSACHNGLDPGTGASAQLAHYTRAKSKTSPGDVAILSTYNAKNATASFGSLSCSNVSCHGGQTINWTSSINVNTDTGCTQCHRRRSQSDQWNSPFSGEHGRGPHVNAGCTACHNTTKLANPAEGAHFLNLSTTAMEVRGSVTIGGGATDVVTYNPGGTVGNGSCTPRSGVGCHGTENW